MEHFPSFDDVYAYYGRQVASCKRAQLSAGMLYQAFGGQGWGALADFERLAVHADYELPQVLGKLGILVYDRSLAALVDGQAPLAAGGRMEVEIRAATVWMGKPMRRELHPRALEFIASHVDFWLWEAGQAKSQGDKPYLRTLITAY